MNIFVNVMHFVLVKTEMEYLKSFLVERSYSGKYSFRLNKRFAHKNCYNSASNRSFRKN